MKLPKYYSKVTPFSKYLSMALFIIFPFIAFFLGIQYQMMITPSYPPTQYIPPPETKIVPLQSHYVVVTATPAVSNVQYKLCAADVRQCPNGSYVHRVGPDCNFATCPQ